MVWAPPRVPPPSTKRPAARTAPPKAAPPKKPRAQKSPKPRAEPPPKPRAEKSQKRRQAPRPQKRYRTVVVASQRPEPLLETPRSVDILGGQEILRLAPRSTPELLESFSGVVVQKTSHGGGSPFVRGFTGQHVLHMLDGVRLNNSTTRYGPNQGLTTIDPFTIRRLELLRGPGSLLYGSDAVGGVLYMITRGAPYRPGALHRWGATFTSRFSTADLSQVYNLGTWTQVRRVTLFAGGSFKDFNALTGGRNIGEQRATGYGEGDYDASIAYHPRPGWTIKLATHGARQVDVPRTDKFTATDFRYYRKQFRDLVYAKVTGSQGRRLERLELTLSYQRHREARQRFRLTRDRIEYEDDFVHTVGLSLVAGSNLGRWSRLTYGADVYYDTVKSSQRRESIATGALLPNDPVTFRGRFVNGSGYVQGGVFVTDTIRPRNWLRLQAGGRFAFSHASIPTDPLAAELGLPAASIQDPNFGFGGGLSATFIPHRSVRLIAAMHHAFRAPNLDDYSHVGSEGEGFDVVSPNLSPEQATSFEAGVKWTRKWVTFSAFGHMTLLQSFIVRDFAGYDVEGEPATVRRNMGRGFVAGLEADLRIRLPRNFRLAAWLSYTHGDIRMPMVDPAWQPMRRMSPLQGFAAAGYRHRLYWAQVELRWSARQDRLSPGDLRDGRICPDGPDSCEGTPGFAIMSVAAGVRIGPHMDVTLRVENLSNEPYKYHGSGVYSPGLSAVALLRIRR